MTPEQIMDKGKLLMKSKAEDYTEKDATHYQNFERQAEITSWFDNPIDQAFVGLIAVKLARLSSLLNRETAPNHESIEDTFVDLTNYCALWGGARTKKNEGSKTLRIEDSDKKFYCKFCRLDFTGARHLLHILADGQDRIVFFCSNLDKEKFIKDTVVTFGGKWNYQTNSLILPDMSSIKDTPLA